MKKIIIMLLISIGANAQVKFFDQTHEQINLIFDPNASFKESGINIGTEFEYVYQGFYIKQGVQNFAVLKGGYTDLITTFGTSFKVGKINNNRFYTGVRAGWILRGSQVYATGGFEAGFDYIFKNGLTIGVRTTRDYREDFKYSFANPKSIQSVFIKIGYKINIKRKGRRLANPSEKTSKRL